MEARLDQHTYFFVVLHAPCQGMTQNGSPTPLETVQLWWDETTALLHQHVHTNHHWIMVDANAALPAGDDDLIGVCGAEPSTKHGDIFVSFLCDHQLAVPATVSHIHSGQTTAWTHSTGKRGRKDYILIPKTILHTVSASWVDVSQGPCHNLFTRRPFARCSSL